LTLGPRLAELGADLLVETLEALQRGVLTPVPQDDSQATLAPILKKEDGLVDFGRTATEIHNRLRGFQPWPGAYAQFRGRNLKIVAARVDAGSPQGAPGDVHVNGDRLLLGCAAGTRLELLQVQPEGKKGMSGADFIRGYRPADGERLG